MFAGGRIKTQYLVIGILLLVLYLFLLFGRGNKPTDNTPDATPGPVSNEVYRGLEEYGKFNNVFGRNPTACETVHCLDPDYLDTRLIEKRDQAILQFLAEGKEGKYRKFHGKEWTYDIWWYLPPVVSCPDRTRIGRITDGGKWVCGLKSMRKDCVVFSLGSAGDFSFEEEVHAETGCIVHTFDPDPKFNVGANKIGKDWLFYHSWGIAAKNQKIGEFQYRTFKETLRELETSCIDILKIDIEGYEWEVFLGLFNEEMPCIGQIQLEIHLSKFSLLLLRDLVTGLEKRGLYVFNTEPNLVDAVSVQEYSFVAVAAKK